mgnify:CR=1 FL=1
MSTNRTKKAKVDKLKPRFSFIKHYWQSLDSSYRRSIVYALMLHAAVVILLGSGWSSHADVKPIVAPRHINAVVVDASAIDALKKSHGINIKNQNGKQMNQQQIGDISNCMNQIYEVFGDRKSMSDNWDLTVSHAGDRLQHASKARGLFIPQYKAIGTTMKQGNYI